MNINIKVIPHDKHRYLTVGDWWFDDLGVLQIRVSDMGNEDYENLVVLHELAEVLLCKKRGITTKQVDDFDMNFEQERAAGVHGQYEEPGDDPKAPYRKEHFFATNIERLMSNELGVDWRTYEKSLNEMM